MLSVRPFCRQSSKLLCPGKLNGGQIAAKSIQNTDGGKW
jgi:hypothetical protein